MAGALSKNANNHPIISFTWVNFIVCRLHLNKAVKTDSSVVFESEQWLPWERQDRVSSAPAVQQVNDYFTFRKLTNLHS